LKSVEIKPKFHVILNAKKDNDFELLCRSLKESEIQPSWVTVIPSKGVELTRNDELEQLLPKESKLIDGERVNTGKYSVVNSNFEIYSYQSIDAAVRKRGCDYVVIVDDGDIASDTLSKIDQRMLSQNDGLIWGELDNGYFVNRKVYMLMEGNRLGLIKERLKNNNVAESYYLNLQS
jgi:hypothetical protein